MPDELPENLGPEEETPGGPGGGPAVKLPKTKNPLSEKTDQIVEKGKEEAKKQVKKAVMRAVRQAVVQAARSAVAWVVAVLGPYAIPIIIAVIVIVLFIVMAIALMSSARKGLHGRGALAGSSIYSDEDISDIQIVLGKSYQLAGNPKDWYFSQTDPRWANIKLAGWSSGPFKDVGCAVTSGAMILKYYGATNVNPPIFGKYLVDGAGSASMNPDMLAKFLTDLGMNKKVVQIPIALNTISSELQAGNPILARGYKTFESSQQHWVVITGIKGNQLLTNNPTTGPNRRVEFQSGNIAGLWALHDK